MNGNLPIESFVYSTARHVSTAEECAELWEGVSAILKLAESFYQDSCLLLALPVADQVKLYNVNGLVKSWVPLEGSPWSAANLTLLLQNAPTQSSTKQFFQQELGLLADKILTCSITEVPGYGRLFLSLLTDSEPRHEEVTLWQLSIFAKLLATEFSKTDWQNQRAAFCKIQELTKIISKAQTEFILEDDRRKAFDVLLNDVLLLMESEYGFIGEVLYDSQQSPYLKAFAMTNIAWDDKTRAFYAEHAPNGLEFRNLNTLFGYTLKTGNQIIANDPARHSEAGGIPHGHPPLNAYLGLPVNYNGQLIAMLGIANRTTGYSESDVEFLQPLLTTVGQLVFATRVSREQKVIQEQLNNTVEASQLGTWTLDLSTNILEVNSRWLDMLGYKMHELKTVTIDWMRQQMHPEDLLRSRTSMQRHLNGEQDYYFSQFRIRHKKGGWVWIQARGRLLTSHARTERAKTGILYGVNIDITEQKNIEHKLTKLAEHVPGLVYQFQRLHDGSIIFPYAGPAAEKILGFTPEQLLTNGAQVFSKVHPQDYPALMQSLNESAKTLKVWKQIFRLSVDGEHYRWLSGQSSPEQIIDGSVLWHGYLQDVTDEMLLQQALKRAKEQAEQAVATKSSFLANMSHEIRTPMNGVIGMLDVMAETNTDPAQTENISLMRDSAYSLLTIIDDILDFSKLEAGKLSLSPVKTQLTETIDKICNMVDFLALKSGVDFFYFIDPAIPDELIFDPDRLRQILVNLLSNAIKFSSKTERKGQVYLSVVLRDQQDDELLVEFKVSDNGIGMSAEVVQTLFQPFTQADASTSRKYGGTGLGLAISQQLVQLMQGVISAKSEPDTGSDFWITIPLKRLSAEASAEPELRGVKVVMVAGRQVQLLEQLVCYLEAEGALPQWLAVDDLMRSDIGKQQERRLWIFDAVFSDGDVIHAAELIKQYWSEQSRFLILGRGRRRKARRISVDTVYIDANVLSKRQFIAAARAAYYDWDIERQDSASIPRQAKAVRQFRILVLEDNTTNQKVIRQQLQRLGYQVTVADNGLIGLQQTQQKHFDLILSDLHMPEVDGYEFITRFREHEKSHLLPRTPVIALTANIVQEELIRAKDLGMDDYLVKPLPVEQLILMLDHYLAAEHDASTQKPLSMLSSDDAVIEKQQAVINAEQVAMLNTAALAEMVGSESVAEILQDYQLSLTQSLGLIENALKEQNWQLIKREAHKLKSSSRFIGCEPIALCFVELEMSCSAPIVDASLIVKHYESVVYYANLLNNEIATKTY